MNTRAAHNYFPHSARLAYTHTTAMCGLYITHTHLCDKSEVSVFPVEELV